MKLFKKKKDLVITESEYLHLHDKLCKELEVAKARQKPTTEKPSGYMRGLEFALYALNSVKPHTI